MPNQDLDALYPNGLHALSVGSQELPLTTKVQIERSHNPLVAGSSPARLTLEAIFQDHRRRVDVYSSFMVRSKRSATSVCTPPRDMQRSCVIDTLECPS